MALGYIMQALQIIVMPMNMFVLILSVLFGLLVGMLPGLTATMAVALLTGLTQGLSPEMALISLLAVYVGSISGGCQSAILLNIPGTPASAATAQDGHAMAQEGKAGLAIFLAVTASFLGTVISVICLLLFTPILSKLALKFGTWEFFLLALFGVLICGNLTSKGNALKGWIAGILGLLVSQIGLDPTSGFARFSYGNIGLMGGIQLIPVMIGIFGFPEIVNVFKEEKHKILEMTPLNAKEGFGIMVKNTVNVIRASIIGVCVGIIPGVGEDVGGWLSYWAAKSNSKDKDKFGKGASQGIIAAETGNNACIGGAMIPVLSLAVPGSTSAAVLLAAFWLHGYRPGPLLMSESPNLMYQICIYLLVSAFAMWGLSLIISRFSVKVLGVKKEILMPIVYLLCIVGSYVINNNMFDIKVMFIFGIIGTIILKLGFSGAPFLLGVVLGPMAESNLIRALVLSDGSLLPFFTRPISLVFSIVILGLILSQFNVFNKIKKTFKRKGSIEV